MAALDREQEARAQLELLLGEYPVVIEIPVLWGHMDSLGHVNNAVFFRYFESSRVSYLDRMFGSEGDWARKERGWILATVSARFRIPLIYPDTVSVGCRAVKLGRDRVLLDHRLVSHKHGRVAAEGDALMVTYDYSAGRKIDIPSEYREALVRLEGHEPPGFER